MVDRRQFYHTGRLHSTLYPADDPQGLCTGLAILICKMQLQVLYSFDRLFTVCDPGNYSQQLVFTGANRNRVVSSSCFA